MINGNQSVLLGYVYANLAGDSRYRERIEVKLEGDGSATVSYEETCAAGGMDGPGGSTGWSQLGIMRYLKGAPAIVNAVRVLLNTGTNGTIKRYGKPNKNFVWRMPGGSGSTNKGLSVAKCQAALEWAMVENLPL